MKLTDERAHAIAQAAIAFEAAKDKASAKLIERERHRHWNGTDYVYVPDVDTWRQCDHALYHARSDRDYKRRAYQRQIKSALFEGVQQP